MIIAQRTVTLTEAGRARPIGIDFHAPQGVKGGWRCAFSVHWPDAPHTGHAMGADSVQALFLAMQMVGTLLYASPHHAAGRLTWSDFGGYGFPLRASARDLAIGGDRDM